MTNSLSPLGTHATSACRRTAPSPYEANVARFGPVAASAIGVAQAAAPAASAVVSFSEKAMKELAAVAPTVAEAVSTVADGVEAVWDKGAALVHSVEDAAGSAGSAIADAAESVVDGVETAWNKGVALVDAVENAADSAASVVGEATDAVVDGVKTAAGNVAGYALLGAASFAGFINDVV